MSLLLEKTKEVTRTLLPVVALVLLLCLTIIQVETNVIIRFLVGSVLLLIGLSIFLWGLDLSMHLIGDPMSKEIATSRTPVKIAILSFLLGFLITVAEPDLLILGSQVNNASGGTLSSFVFVYMVSIGVGILISLGVFRLLKDRPLNVFMAITYGLIFAMALFVSEEFLAISFDASGATTGALTTPFILALSFGLSNVKGGKHSEENSFGLVGIMSAGPILAVMFMSIVTGQKNIQGVADEFIVAKGIWGPIAKIIPRTTFESFAALIPISALFFILNFKKFKLPKDDIIKIIKGLSLSLIGLICFLTAVNSGFMDMGRILGMKIAKTNQWMLVLVGFFLGLIVVLVEPAVHVLGKQIEEVTGGHIPLNLIRMTLSIGVATAIALSTIRIVIPEVKLWYFLIPGFAIAILLSFKSDPVFVGIAYDAGGVASGPMTATFVLAFTQGAASVIDTANVLVDGFGVIAMVAMAPVLSIIALGVVFKHKKVEYPVTDEKAAIPSSSEEDIFRHNCIAVVVNRNFAEEVVNIARESGATGATIIHGRGKSGHKKVMLPILNVELLPEKEIVLLITGDRVSKQVADNLMGNIRLVQEGEVAVFIAPTEFTIKNPTTENNLDCIV